MHETHSREVRFVTGIICVGLFVFALAPFNVLAFGISPPKINETRLVPGSTVTRTISLVQGNPVSDTEVEVTVDSRDMREWMSFDPGLVFTIPAGVQQFPFRVTVAVPENAELGNYSAFVRIRTSPKPAEGAGTVAVAEGARLDVDVTVGDHVVEEWEVKALKILDIKERDPLTADARIENLGNVPSGPAAASFELFDKFGNVRLAFSTIEADVIGAVPAFAEESIRLEFPINLRIAPGSYRGHVKVLNEEGGVVREVQTGFTVHERRLADWVLTYVPHGAAILGIIVILLIIMGIRRRRRRARAQQYTDNMTHDVIAPDKT